MDKHVAFVISRPYVDALACFREPIRFLAEKGWKVDLYTQLCGNSSFPCFFQANIAVIPLETGKYGSILLLKRLVFHRPKYQWIFVVPGIDFHYVALASRIAKIPYVCISDEIMTDNEAVTREQRKARVREKNAHRRAAFTIALSEERISLIRDVNKLGLDHEIFMVPNSSPAPSKRLVSHYFHETLNISREKKILVHAGSWWWRLDFMEIEKVVQQWRGDTVLVFQGRNMNPKFGKNEFTTNIRFSMNVLPSYLLDYAISSADIGLALYDTNTVNHQNVGTAGGKIPLYMKNELPVIATYQKSLEWIESEGCGVCVRSLHDIEKARDKISEKYNWYVENVKRTYTKRLDFNKHFEPVYSRLSLG